MLAMPLLRGRICYIKKKHPIICRDTATVDSLLLQIWRLHMRPIRMSATTHRFRPLGFLMHPTWTMQQQAIQVKDIMEAYSTAWFPRAGDTTRRRIGMKWRQHPHPLSRTWDLSLPACDLQYIRAGQVYIVKISEGRSCPPLILMTPMRSCMTTKTTALLSRGNRPIAVR